MWRKERCEYMFVTSDIIKQHIPETNAQVGIKFGPLLSFLARPIVRLENAFF